jgi:hypothetical protein
MDLELYRWLASRSSNGLGAGVRLALHGHFLGNGPRALLPVFLMSTLGASATFLGVIEGIAEGAG